MMNINRAPEHYLRAKLQTCSPVEVVVLLYEGAIRFAREAGDAIENGDFPRKADRIGRALSIVQELENTLDDSAAPALAGQLRVLYSFAQRELLEASARREVSHIDAAVRILE